MVDENPDVPVEEPVSGRSQPAPTLVVTPTSSAPQDDDQTCDCPGHHHASSKKMLTMYVVSSDKGERAFKFVDGNRDCIAAINEIVERD